MPTSPLARAKKFRDPRLRRRTQCINELIAVRDASRSLVQLDAGASDDSLVFAARLRVIPKSVRHVHRGERSLDRRR